MKKIISLLIFLSSSVTYAEVISLICIDNSNPKYQMVIVFDNKKNILLQPSNGNSVYIDNEKISYAITADNYFYKTHIYRATGTFTVYAKENNIDIGSYSGTCTKKLSNKF